MKVRWYDGGMWLAMQSDTRNITAARTTLIRVYDGTGNVIETHEHKGDFKE
jgi:hypothetical protein